MSKLILASASPRRKELLKVAGFKFKIQVPDVDEAPLRNETPPKMVQRLSLKKAHAIADSITQSHDFFILAADTTVVSARGKNLGKPCDLAHAFQMLKMLEGKKHYVYTAYSILRVSNRKVVKKKVRMVKTEVTFKPLTEVEIHFYLEQGESMDKAGAYAAQGAGMMLVSKMNGSYTNVVGLPLSHVLDDLKKMGFNSDER